MRMPDWIGGGAGQRNDLTQHVVAAVIAVILSVAGFLLQGHIGLGLSDEGYLWYGVKAVLAGEVPLRDFSAYDPGRYYLAAALLGIAGDSGITALRVVSHLLQAIALYVVMMIAAGNARWPGRGARTVLMLVTGIVFAFWMFELYKLYDKLTVILLVASLAALIEKPSRQRYFVFGVVVGLAAVVGRNHGVYGALGGGLAMLYLAAERADGRLRFKFSEGPLVWAAGVLAGFSPILLMALLVPGFLTAFLASLKLMLEIGATNIPLPVPWPWLYQLEVMPFDAALGTVAEGLSFILLLLFCGGGLLYLVAAKATGKWVIPALAAAILISPGYTHYAFSRADLYHVATGVLPLLIALFVVLGRIRSFAIAAVAALFVLAASIRLTIPYHPLEKICGQPTNRHACVRLQVGNDVVLVQAYTARFISELRGAAARIPAEREVLVVPWYSGVYPVLGKRSPVWDTYAVFPRSVAFQQEEIARIAKARPGMVYIANGSFDGRSELSFSNNNPLIFQYIVSNYVRVGNTYLFVDPDVASAFMR